MKPMKTNAFNMMNNMLSSMPEKNSSTSGNSFREKLTKRVEDIGGSALKGTTAKETKSKIAEFSSYERMNNVQKNSKTFQTRKMERNVNISDSEKESNIELMSDNNVLSSELNEAVELEEKVEKEEILLDLLQGTEDESEEPTLNDEVNLNLQPVLLLTVNNTFDQRKILSESREGFLKTEYIPESQAGGVMNLEDEPNLLINDLENAQNFISVGEISKKESFDVFKTKDSGKESGLFNFQNGLGLVSEKNEEKIDTFNRNSINLIKSPETDHSIQNKIETFLNHSGKQSSESEEKNSGIENKTFFDFTDKNLPTLKMRTFNEVVEEKLQPKFETAKLMLEDIRYQMNQSKNQMKVQLKPRELGEMTLDLQILRGSVVAKIFVDNERAKVMIEQNLVHLRDAFKDSGTEIKTVEVYVGNGTNFNLNQQNMAHSKNSQNQMNYNKNQRMYDDMLISEDEISPDWGQSEGFNLLA